MFPPSFFWVLHCITNIGTASSQQKKSLEESRNRTQDPWNMSQLLVTTKPPPRPRLSICEPQLSHCKSYWFMIIVGDWQRLPLPRFFFTFKDLSQTLCHTQTAWIRFNLPLNNFWGESLAGANTIVSGLILPPNTKEEEDVHLDIAVRYLANGRNRTRATCPASEYLFSFLHCLKGPIAEDEQPKHFWSIQPSVKPGPKEFSEDNFKAKVINRCSPSSKALARKSDSPIVIWKWNTIIIQKQIWGDSYPRRKTRTRARTGARSAAWFLKSLCWLFSNSYKIYL